MPFFSIHNPPTVDISPAIKAPWATRSPTGCLAAYTALTCTG